MKIFALLLFASIVLTSCEGTDGDSAEHDAPMTEQDSTIQDLEEAGEVLMLH